MGHYDLRFAKPLDRELIIRAGSRYRDIITVEDGAIRGGVGEAVAAILSGSGCRVHQLGIPDNFIEHGTPAELYRLCGFDSESIYKMVKELLK